MPARLSSEEPHAVRRGWNGAGWLLSGLFLVSVGVGFMGWLRYNASEQELTASLIQMSDQGSRLNPIQCIDSVLEWRRQCSAMKNLCDASVYRMMESCLGGADRRKYCADNEEAMSATSFGYDDCAQRGLDRGAKKACAAAYRALDAFCKAQAGEAAKEGDETARLGSRPMRAHAKHGSRAQAGETRRAKDDK